MSRASDDYDDYASELARDNADRLPAPDHGPLHGLIHGLGELLLFLIMLPFAFVMWSVIAWLWCASFAAMWMAPIMLGAWIFYLLGWRESPF